MKKIKYFILGFCCLILASCFGGNVATTSKTKTTQNTSTNTFEPTITTTTNCAVPTTFTTPGISTTAFVTTNVEPVISTTLPSTTTSSAITTIEPVITTTTTNTSTTTTTSNEPKLCTLSEINSLGANLANNATGIKVKFNAMYVKNITDNNDHLFLFVDEDSYVCVRFTQSQYTDHIKNRYTYCYYDVVGTLSKVNNNVEVAYESLTNTTTTKSSYDYSNITTNKSSIKSIYDDMSNITLSNKYNGIGKIVTFSGVVMATDREDAQKKAVLYDNKNVITVIGDSTICSADSINNTQLKITGIVSILKGQPAILLLDKEVENKTINIDYSNVVEKVPSYFSKWYNVSDRINNPSFADFSILYKINGYVNVDEGRTNKLYFGLTDTANGKLDDNGIKTSIKGVYLMNYQGQSSLTSYNSNIYNAYQNETNINLCASLYQFDTQNHGWKMFMVDSTFQEVANNN